MLWEKYLGEVPGRSTWEKYLELEEHSLVSSPHVIGPSGSMFSKATVWAEEMQKKD
jgi:hypothetical protein